jgi:methyltransferase
VEPWSDSSRGLYTLLVGAVALQRLAELALSRRNVRHLLAEGGVEVGRSHYRWMVLLHTTFLFSCVLEVWSLRRPLIGVLAIAMLTALVAAAALRGWVILTLGRRWSTRVVCLPGAALLRGGPYRFLRHPNYVAVVVEMTALPLVHTAWLTALFFTAANLVLLRERVRVEERALASFAEGAGGD